MGVDGSLCNGCYHAEHAPNPCREVVGSSAAGPIVCPCCRKNVGTMRERLKLVDRSCGSLIDPQDALAFAENEVRLALQPGEVDPELADAEAALRESMRPSNWYFSRVHGGPIVAELDRLRAEVVRLKGEG